MGVPRTEDWYYCPTCGSKVIVGSDGCLACACEQVETNAELETRDNDGSYASAHVDRSEWTEDFSMGELEGKSRASLIPVMIALVLAVFFVVIFVFLSVPNN